MIELSALCEKLGATFNGPFSGSLPIKGLAPLDAAGAGHLSFVARPDYEEKARHSQASAILVAKPIDGVTAVQLVHKNPYYAFARAAQMFFEPRHPFSGVQSGAVIHPTAVIDPSASVGAGAWIGPKARVGANSYVYPGCFLGEGAVVGRDTVLRANVVLEFGCRVGDRVLIHAASVIGGDGFGFAPGTDDIAKIPQVGIVVIDDDVEVGASCTIDRAAMGETKIGKGSKLDSHVHIAHNVQIGRNVMMSGFSGVAGSTKVGDWVMTGGHSAINGHIEIADRVQIGAMAGVIKSISEPGQYLGFPAQEAGKWRRQQVYLRRLEDLDRRIKELEQRKV